MAQSDPRELSAHRLFHQGDYHGARQIFEQLLDTAPAGDDGDDVRAIYEDCVASCVASQGDLDQAAKIFASIKPVTNSLLYNRALCAYRQGNLDESMSLVDQLIDRCERLTPELFLADERHLAKNMRSPSDNSDPAGLALQLEESRLLEAINLKSAIAFKSTGNHSIARQILDQSPLKAHHLIDCVTLHNQAIYEIQSLPDESLKKLLHLSQLKQQLNANHHDELDDYIHSSASDVPPETELNLISLLVSGGRADLAAEHFKNVKLDEPADRSGGFRVVSSGLSKEQILYINSQLERSLNPNSQDTDPLYMDKLEKLVDQLLIQIKTATTMPADTRPIVDLTMIVASDLGSILWSNNQLKALERLMRKIKFIYCTNQYHEDLWLKNMAHILYMMDNRFEECSQMYERLMMTSSPNQDSSSPVNSASADAHTDPMVLGSLCVSYVLTGRNGEAEELIKRIELEQEAIKQQQQQHQANSSTLSAGSMIAHHRHQVTPFPQKLDIVNLAIETLYCVKNNYEFGLTRMFKTLYPLETRLNDQVWFHVKRCILSLLDSHCKQLIYVRDGLLNQVLEFLIDCEKHCQHIRTTTTTTTRATATKISNHKHESQTTSSMTIPTDGGDKSIGDQSIQESGQPVARNTIFYEARYLRAIILAIIHDN